MEEDDASDAGVDPFISGEEELAVKPPVLLRVLGVDALEALGDTTWRCQETGKTGGVRDTIGYNKPNI